MAPSDSDQSLRKRAFALIKERSFKFGTFTLASGRVSNYYLDMKPSMFSPEGATLLAELILRRLDGVILDYVGGLELGAVPLVATVSMASYGRGRPITGFFVRKAAKDHGTRKRVDALYGSLDGKRVVILEDVTTTGESAMSAVTAARESGAEVVLVLSVVDREEGAAAFYAEAGIPFDSLFKASEFLAK
jgi:orotate phosphoribosyltransferase